MRSIIQRVTQAKVKANNQIVGCIENGLLVLVGFEPEDTTEDFLWMAKKISQLRIFNDSNQIMNLSLSQTQGELLLVSQFTLHAQTKKGNRPSYTKASKPLQAKVQYQNFVEIMQTKLGKAVQQGVFGANMQVELVNDGPVTIFIDSKNKE